MLLPVRYYALHRGHPSALASNPRSILGKNVRWFPDRFGLYCRVTKEHSGQKCRVVSGPFRVVLPRRDVILENVPWFANERSLLLTDGLVRNVRHCTGENTNIRSSYQWYQVHAVDLRRFRFFRKRDDNTARHGPEAILQFRPEYS